MTVHDPSSLGIVACPGGERFSREIIGHLRQIYRKQFEKRVSKIVDKYDIAREDAIKESHLFSDLMHPVISGGKESLAYEPPNFHIPANFTRFANGEVKTELLASVRDKEVYIIQDVENRYPQKFSGGEQCLSVNDNFFVLLVTIDAVLQSSPKSVTLVLPSYPYARQHKKKGREGLTAARLAQIFEFMGVGRLITLDIHSTEIQNSFNKLRLENLHASYQILLKLSELVDFSNDDLVVVAPDTGAVGRNKFYASSLKKPLALIYKERDYSKVSTDAGNSNISSLRLLGDVSGKTVFMADDMLGTGGTLIKAMRMLREQGAERIICAVSLPLFTGEAAEHFDKAYHEGLFDRIIGTNAVYHDESILSREWYISANVSNLFARAISRLHHRQSLSPLLDNSKIIQWLIKKQKKEE
ncbi:ribose-phosphate diphosphokinase [Spirochaetia bacterium 38H-sp]|uniref:ribose-phosphate diphosphokinase n=1 Tax=Rarispira pelagica TaxID=3141764 RepID=A0ABU9UDI6_9SPIR